MTESIVTTPGRTRLRRLRRTRALRNLVAETTVAAEHLIMPHFVVPAKRANEPISSMPGIAQQGLENVVKTDRQGLRARHSRRAVVRPPRARRQDARRRRGRGRRRRRAKTVRALEARVRRRADRHDGRVLVRVHGPWPLRHPRARPSAERSVAQPARRHGRAAMRAPAPTSSRRRT